MEILLLRCVVVGLMHGDMDQNTRNQVITAFKKKEMPVLIATDVAGGSQLHCQTVTLTHTVEAA